MQAAVAEAVARTTREQAVTDARNDLQELRRRAVEAGRDRSRRFIKTSRIDTSTGEIRYNPAGRLLRDWYLHVYLNTLRATLGEPAVAIDAQQVEDTTAQLRRIRTEATGLNALHAVGVVRDVAVEDAAHAATDIVVHLGRVASRRAVLHASDERFDGEQLPIHVARHWYQRCYDDHVHGVTRSRQPLAEVTDAEERQVSLVLESGQARRLVGPDGIPLVSAHGTVLTNLDRRLMAGEAGLVSPISDAQHHTDAARALRSRVTQTWTTLDRDERAQWLRLAGADPASHELTWSDLNDGDQSKVIRLYLETHRPEHLGVPFEGHALGQAPRLAAGLIFNHHAPLDANGLESSRWELEVASSSADSDPALGRSRSPALRATEFRG